MKPKAKLAATLCGISGEYFVAAELSRRGYVASLTLRNTRGIDVLASNANATKSVGIQVKTSQRLKAEWLMNEKAETDRGDRLFYVFVCLPSTGQPTFYVVPRNVVADYVTDNHQRWLATPGRLGQPHQDNPNRVFRDAVGGFKERWDLLDLD